MIRFDAYTATTLAARPPEVIDLVFDRFSLGIQGHGFHGFEHRLSVRDRSGVESAAVSWGGRQGQRVMLEVKGEKTPDVVEVLRQRYPHRCTRVDSCFDVEGPGAFDLLLGHCLDVKREHGLYGDRAGDWDFPELGRTQYLGATTSAVRGRLYEKGKQPEYRHLGRPDLVRLEIQVRPQKEAKDAYAHFQPTEVWGASKWSRDLAARVLTEDVERLPAGTVWRESSTARKTRWLCRQYGPLLLDLKRDFGDWECVGRELERVMGKLRSES
jgi:DNA relaxase NicK